LRTVGLRTVGLWRWIADVDCGWCEWCVDCGEIVDREITDGVWIADGGLWTQYASR